MSTQALHDQLKQDIRFIGTILGQVVKEQNGQDLFELIETIRHQGKKARDGNRSELEILDAALLKVDSENLVNLARAFAMFLNLANITEQHHQNRQRLSTAIEREQSGESGSPLLYDFSYIINQDISADTLFEHIEKLDIELVLTAHPTEIVRRSVSSKLQRLTNILRQLDNSQLSHFQQQQLHQDLKQIIVELWATDEIKRKKPTPVDESQMALVTIEESLWHAIPKIMRELDYACFETTGHKFPLDKTPIRFSSWIGGDRDGNPNTTPDVTRTVIRQAQTKALTLFTHEIRQLWYDLSMIDCNQDIRDIVGDVDEPYRAFLLPLLDTLEARLEQYLDKNLVAVEPIPTNVVLDALLRCHQSLIDCNDNAIADGRLTNIIRLLNTFGMPLIRLDIRQEAIRHSEALDAITQYLGLGSYLQWSESERQTFLIAELKNNRPLIDARFKSSTDISLEVKDVIETFEMIAEQPAEAFGAYVISMAETPSDILAVALLQKTCLVKEPLRIAPLFENLRALNGAAETIDQLFSIALYKDYIDGKQEVMIGYSDSAKDAGKIAAAWALYQAQENVVAVCKQHDINLTLFHGRGGTVARGGGPAHEAILSQPPGSIDCTLRVTEQGEVIQAKYGFIDTAVDSLQVYISAVLEATLLPPRAPEPAWRNKMQTMAERSYEGFNRVIRESKHFVDYFKQATPQAELGLLNIGSRPTHRREIGGVEHLRAIPWIFAWTQNRLMLPAWLGVDDALAPEINQGELEILHSMYQQWPFFRATISSIEMVFSKTNADVASIYEHRLADAELTAFGDMLRKKLAQSVDALLQISQHTRPIENDPVVRQSVDVRNTYVVPLNILQAELLCRIRKQPNSDYLNALLVTINGIAAGMRNTG